MICVSCQGTGFTVVAIEYADDPQLSGRMIETRTFQCRACGYIVRTPKKSMTVEKEVTSDAYAEVHSGYRVRDVVRRCEHQPDAKVRRPSPPDGQ